MNNPKYKETLGCWQKENNNWTGVPQGSGLCPLLFLVYINDLERNIKSNIKLFVDDTMLFSIVKNPEISANDLNHDIDVIRQWPHQWKLEFNSDPIKQVTEVLFSCKKTLAINVIAILQKYNLTRSGNQSNLGTTSLLSQIIEKSSCRQENT